MYDASCSPTLPTTHITCQVIVGGANKSKQVCKMSKPVCLKKGTLLKVNNLKLEMTKFLLTEILCIRDKTQRDPKC